MAWGAAAAVAAPIIGGIFSAFGAARQNKEARAAAQRQMDFQREMYGSRYQMTMADMKKAGLNPMLAYQQGVGGAPGGSSYSPANIGAGAGAAGAGVATSALNLRRQNEEFKNLKADRQLKRQLNRTEIVKQVKAQQDTNESYARMQNIRQDFRIKSPQEIVSAIDKKMWDTRYGRILRYMGLSAREINQILSAPAAAAGGFVGGRLMRKGFGPRRKGRVVSRAPKSEAKYRRNNPTVIPKGTKFGRGRNPAP